MNGFRYMLIKHARTPTHAPTAPNTHTRASSVARQPCDKLPQQQASNAREYCMHCTCVIDDLGSWADFRMFTLSQ